MYEANLFEINCLGFVSHWIQCLTLLQEGRPIYLGASVTQKVAELDLFQEAALLNPKVRSAPNILRTQPQDVDRYITSPGEASTFSLLEQALRLLALGLFALHHTVGSPALPSPYIKILPILYVLLHGHILLESSMTFQQVLLITCSEFPSFSPRTHNAYSLVQ